MKISKYNILRKFDGRTVFFNGMTCALAIVDENFLKVIKDIENDEYDERKYDAKLIEDMKLSGCILDNSFNEISELSYRRNLAKYDMTHLGLTVAPTLECNFRCQYCFEKHINGYMSEDIQTMLVEFVKNRLTVGKRFSVTWYGGEPLLAKEIVYNLSEQFLDVCQMRNIEYDAFIVTNASLLEETDIDYFKKYHINGAQVTIDGPKAVHDKRRRNITGESTFDRLIDRVNLLLNNGITVIVRVNIDKENIEQTDELLDTLMMRIEKHEKLKIDFGQVTPFTDICKSIESNCYNNEQYADVMLPLYAKVNAHGFKNNKMSIYPTLRANFCSSDYANSFVVDYLGNLYKCWNHVGNKKYSCGSVRSFGQDVFSSNYIAAVEWDPITHIKCNQCQYLPICMGGCPDAMNGANGEPVCGTIKYNLENVLEYYYRELSDGGANT